MKINFILIVFAFLGQVSFAQNSQDFVVPANKAYVEPFTAQRPGVRVPVGWVETRDVVSGWRDQTKSVVWIVYQKPGDYDLLFDNTVTADKNLEFELKVSATYQDSGFKPFSKKITFKGDGKADSLFATKVHVPKTGYFRYELKPISDPQSAITIKSLIFRSSTAGAHVNHIDYQSTPSVHLAFSSTAPNSKTYNWMYQEIVVPKGGDALATYYMSLGFFRGYMGIQTNSATERRVLFSVWDSKDAEHDTTITKHDYVSLVDKGELTTVNNFGGEGTGGQSYVKTANWKTGEPVKFLMNIVKSDNNSVVLSAWYKVEGQDWTYVASWRAPKEQRLFDGFYSFLENFGYTNGQLRREAYYYNAYGKDAKTGQWINFNKVRFSNTDGRVGQRDDFEQGVSPKYPDRFYMSAGGYTPTLKTANEMPLATKPFVFDLKPFEQRVELALKNELKNSANKK
ncbi:DUF3472 domain-containing protein [Pedobacter frigoris]|uniref:DUF3472 domain-containing protein n=1 Tax=Pedobacter frigoris TaxID=2571272 RepID=UPI00292CEF7A|nr:DUF3472 domain-containing protein [Pedobacter frigoris]